MLGEGNVFTSVCCSVHGVGLYMPGPRSQVGYTGGQVYQGQLYWGVGITVGIGIPKGYTHPPVLATTTHTVGKQAVRILLECFLVLVYVPVAVSLSHSGWPTSSQNEIPCVFPEFSLCYINFPCVTFMQKLTISSVNKGHIITVLLHIEAYNITIEVYNLIF